jgi:anti-sigma regulatory factor (Ser/Thr protein kinase)
MMRAVPVIEASQIAESRRIATERAATIGFDATRTGRVAIVATELATNLIKHGGGGELLISAYDDSSGSGIELIALDKGPGIGNLQSALADGYSSAGTAGHGLGAIRRQSHIMELASWPTLGTAVLARIDANNGGPKQSVFPPWGAVCVPKPGEEVSGDAWFAADTEHGRTMLVVDGLGHGPDAAAAAREALRLFRRSPTTAVPEALDALHRGLHHTRGAAIAIARFDHGRALVVYGGIGNISGAIVQGQQIRRMVSLNGTAGHNARKIQAFDYPYAQGLVVMASDGLATGWSLNRYPGLTQAHPTLIAAVLYRDFSRRHDDVTVLVARGEPQQ